MQFMLRIRWSQLPGEGSCRYVDRPTTDEAVDAAVRWLRLHRNANRVFSVRCDMWEVLIPNEEVGYQVVASGRATG